MINQIKPNVYQLHFHNFGSCVYLIKINNKNILIDSSSKDAKEELISDLKSLKINPKEINALIITHNHYDHIENLDLFTNAKIYLPEELSENSIIKEIPEMKIIKTPGHTPESKCYLYEDILFSGDSIFDNGYVGRTDLPGGDINKLNESINKLSKIKYKFLCAGHLV